MAEKEATPKPDAKPRKRRLWLKVGLPLIAVLIVGCALWVWVTLGFVYSSTQHTGYVKNLSQRGWLCKTWEGELSLSPTPSLADTSKTSNLQFTIRNDSVARALQLAAGGKVTLSIDEHRGVPTSCFGETENFVQGFTAAQ
ncbi:MAG: hypothetical protein ABI026_06915 [Gemmatimonadaceae bacterium]